LIRIAAGSDGALWLTQSYPDGVGRITTVGVISEFPLPNPASGIRGIAAGPDGTLWFTEWTGGKIGRISTAGIQQSPTDIFGQFEYREEFGCTHPNCGIRLQEEGPKASVFSTRKNPGVNRRDFFWSNRHVDTQTRGDSLFFCAPSAGIPANASGITKKLPTNLHPAHPSNI